MDNSCYQKKVSVIIPTYNRAKFISSAVESIINQKYNNLEIIIVDDSSTDNTRSVVASLKEKYSNIVYCHNERSKGPSGARNTGILKSTGDYLSFLDSDDTWLDRNLANGLKVLNKYPEIDVLFGNSSVVDFGSGKHQYDFFDQKKILHTLKHKRLSSDLKVLHDNLFVALINENFFALVSSIIRRSTCNNVLLDESIMLSEDRDFAIKLYKQANATFAFRKDPVCIAYRHDANTNNPKDLNDLQQVAKAHLYLFTKYLRIYNLSTNEKRILTRLIAKKLSNLSYLYGKNKEYKNALSSMLRSFKYSLTLTQFKDLMKVLTTFFLVIKVDISKLSIAGK